MNSNSHTLTRGNKQFELCNHLGNVLVTVQDRKRSVDVNADNQADYYLSYLRTVTNYYAYGSAMPGIGGSIKECTVTSTNLTLKKYPYFHTFSNDSTSGFTAGSGARSVTNPTHNVLHLESIWTTRPLANKTIYLKNGANYALKFNLAGFSVVSGYTHTVKVRILLPGNTLSYTYTATGNQTINFTSNTTGYATVEISSQIAGSGTYSVNPYIDIDNFNLSWDSTYTAYVNTCGSNPENYKYGFNTQEKDNEIAGENNFYTAEFWEYDARIARRWNVDPVFKEFESPYACNNLNPIISMDIDGDEPEIVNNKLKASIGPPKLKTIYQILRIWPGYWGPKGRVDLIGCKTFRNMFRRQKYHRPLTKVVTVTKYRTKTRHLNVDVVNGQSIDLVINTPVNTNIVINKFDDQTLTDILVVEDGVNNGVGSDPSNSNTGNDFYTSPSGWNTPIIRNQIVAVNTQTTRIRVLGNVNGSPGVTQYDLDIDYTFREYKVRKKVLYLGFIPLFWKYKKEKDWTATNSTATKKQKSKIWK